MKRCFDKCKLFLSNAKFIIIDVIFTGYCVLMVWELFIGPYRTHGGKRRYNIIPLKTIKNMILYRKFYTPEIFFINLAGNVLMFIPLGFFLPIISKKMRSFKIVFASCFFIILTAELLQLIFNVGSFDVDDIILNMLGCIIGYGIYRAVCSYLKRQHN